jgi:hypothetical protein
MSGNQDGEVPAFRMLKPSILKEVLASGLGQYTKSVLIFSFNEGSIIAKVGQDDNIHS